MERGINLFDASEVYPVPPKPETQGRTEAIIGTWLASRKGRGKMMIATKVAGRGKMNWVRKDGSSPTRQSPAQIMEAVEASLKRLKTDYIDLYQLHWPDRPMRVFEGLDYLHLEGDTHPIHDILGVLGKLVAGGRVRFVGLSNETPWGVMSFLKASEQHGLPRARGNCRRLWRNSSKLRDSGSKQWSSASGYRDASHNAATPIFAPASTMTALPGNGLSMR